MTFASPVAVALIFLWLGMVVAISFIEAPLKFRAPGVTLQIGLGIGRLVFRALNGVEAVLAVVIVVALALSSPAAAASVAIGVAVTALVVQLLGVRPQLAKRSDAVLAPGPASAELQRSRAHHVYVGLELVKVTALVIAGALLLAG